MSVSWSLIPHPADAPPAGLSLRIEARLAAGHLVLAYALRGDLSALCLPETPPDPGCLWKHTCFEAFLARPDGSYTEYNFALPAAWQGYVFGAYRQPLPEQPKPPLTMRWQKTDHALRLRVKLPGTNLTRLGLSAVLEDTAGRLSYWALCHPAQKPDFHLAEGWMTVGEQARGLR
ncbi:MAG: hypothetical protein LBL69_06875 [Zoogloeaceae bacterium]|nr:hypothetical protein [Zoogloeaceae bacterium]